MQIKRKLIPLSVALAFAGVSASVMAGPVEMFAMAQWELGAGASSTPINPLNPTPTPGKFARDPGAGLATGSVDVLTGPSDAFGNNAFFHPYGYTFGGNNFFGSRASGAGQFNAVSTFHLEQVVDTGSNTLPYVFNFHVDNGELSAQCEPCTGGGTASIDIVINIDNGNDGSVETSFLGKASLVVNGDGSCSFTRTGLAANLSGIGADESGGAAPSRNLFFGWGETPFSLALGSYGGGVPFKLSYDLIAISTGDFTGTTATCERGGQFGEFFPDGENPVNLEFGGELEAAGPGGAAVGIGGGEGGFFCTGWLPGTGARAGDPGGIPNHAQSTFGVSAVPEPGALGLLAVGFGAAALAGRRRGKRKN